MLIRKPADLRHSDVTPKQFYLNRRRFLAAGSAIAGAWALPTPAGATMKLDNVTKSAYTVNEKITPLADITSYNNYYEFGTDKGDPSHYANTLRPSPWQVQVGGLVNKPKTYDLDSIMKIAPLEERIYRHRCVEAWSIVVPWIGFPLAALLKQVEPNAKAKYVAFQTLYDPKQMPLGNRAGIELPYVEGLRLDEAMHPLALLAVGLYGETLPNQNGAPFRLVVPWKYGFKSIKSIVKITLTDKQPPTTWNIANAREYGFYSNVNPTVDHPRWTQSQERRLGELFKRKTLMFNGYPEVASLYTGMDLRKNY
ncbi:MAG TPA: protein-methionine-sulfoxide reductase catalytic subunit MsrP [Bryobacteraceae bacterium]|jgi:methionine sulfoxide reductase catalytic subunit|nr:protein-methionine-sulfoxide reductase catalytic subunit MsrP [Bryobacteraceae bacterium]